MERKARHKKLVVVYSPYPSRRAAVAAARQLINAKIIACANIYASESIYRWKGKNVEQKEWTLIAKTSSNLQQRVCNAIKASHPYELPAILVLPATANTPYIDWVRNETAN